ncbi:MAG: hypothetical protein GX129_09165 [Clostridiales bacterium]|jgi:uncharacterized protein YjdB|nr:hypothetical protein [Clostridiales bacterium]
MTRIKKILLSFLLCFILPFLAFSEHTKYAEASNSFSLVFLSSYKKTVSIGEDFYIIAIATNGKMPKWTSSSSRIASVNTYGKVTAKKEGNATITAKVSGGEASCKVTVRKTEISISSSAISIEGGESFLLSARSSTKTPIIWKSSHKSIATVDDKGMVIAIKPGESTITATADGSIASCKVKVKFPTIKLDKKKVTLYRGQSIKLSAHVSSGVEPTWKSNKKSVATINPDGTISAIKNGSATVTATVDGVSTTCEVIVKKPDIGLGTYELTIRVGSNELLSAKVSSGNNPEWSTSNPNVATVDSKGQITGIKKGRAYIYAKEDGTKVRCTVYVTD